MKIVIITIVSYQGPKELLSGPEKSVKNVNVYEGKSSDRFKQSLVPPK